MGGRHHHLQSTVRFPTTPSQGRRMGPTLQYSLYHRLCGNAKKYRPNTSAAPSSIQMQPVCVLNSLHFLPPQGFYTCCPFCRRLLSAPHASGVTSSQRPPDCLPQSCVSQDLPLSTCHALSCAHLSIYLPVVTGLTWMGTLSVLAQQVRSPGPW